MGFGTPLAFALAALLPVVIALYFLKLRREQRTVSSTYLWQEMVRDVAANAPWQRLRINWLLVLQILFLIALIVALARPFSWTQASAGDHLVLVVDTSASMGATDVAPSRLTAAAEQARYLADSLPTGTPVTLIAAGKEVDVLLSGSADRAQLDLVLRTLQPGGGSSDLATALELAAALSAGEPKTEIVVLSDGGVRLPDRVGVPVGTRYLPVGTSGENQAISALSLEPGVAGQGLTAFVRVANHGTQDAEQRLTLRAYGLDREGAGAQGTLVAARDLALPARDGLAMTFADLPPETTYVEARLEGGDVLALDDSAWAVAPVVTGAQIQIVGPGNRFLETALALLPGVEVTTIALEDYEASWTAGDGSMATEGPTDAEQANWLTIFDTVLPEEGHYPPGALLFIGPLRSTEFFSVTGALETPLARPAGADEPLLRFVDLRDIVIQRSARLALPAWGRPVVVTADGSAAGESQSPLLVAGEADGRRLALLAFDLRLSDLPLRVAFPLLLANLVDYLSPGMTGALPATVAPGQPVALPLPPQAEAAVVVLPDGKTTRLPAGQADVLLGSTGETGVYRVDWEVAGDRWLLGRFAVNAFSPLESDVSPRAELTFGTAGSESVIAQRPVRQEWWRWLAWVALALLLIEWLVQYRGALTRVWERIQGRAARKDLPVRPARYRDTFVRGQRGPGPQR